MVEKPERVAPSPLVDRMDGTDELMAGSRDGTDSLASRCMMDDGCIDEPTVINVHANAEQRRFFVRNGRKKNALNGFTHKSQG